MDRFLHSIDFLIYDKLTPSERPEESYMEFELHNIFRNVYPGENSNLDVFFLLQVRNMKLIEIK